MIQLRTTIASEDAEWATAHIETPNDASPTMEHPGRNRKKLEPKWPRSIAVFVVVVVAAAAVVVAVVVAVVDGGVELIRSSV